MLLNLKHLAKFSYAQFIAILFILIAKIAIVLISVYTFEALVVWCFTSIDEETGSLIAPMICVGVMTYFTTNVFLGVFNTIVKSLLFCLAIDMDMNNGTPRFGPPTFHDSAQKVQNNKKS